MYLKLLISIQKPQFWDLAIPSTDLFLRNDNIDKYQSFANDIVSNLSEQWQPGIKQLFTDQHVQLITNLPICHCHPNTGSLLQISSWIWRVTNRCLTLSCPGTGRGIVKKGHSKFRLGSKELSSLRCVDLIQCPNICELIWFKQMRKSHLWYLLILDGDPYILCSDWSISGSLLTLTAAGRVGHLG